MTEDKESSATATTSGVYLQAAREALVELRAALSRKAEVTASLEVLDDEIFEQRMLIDRLMEKLGRAEAEKLRNEFKNPDLFQPLAKRTGTEKFSNTVEIIKSEPTKQWRIEELKNQLANLGIDASAKEVGNVLGRLAKEGKLVRLRRGVYRLPAYGIVVEGDDEAFDV